MVSAPPQSALQTGTEERLRFEMLLADVCAQFVNVAASDVDSKIENAQRVICESLRVDHSTVWEVSKEKPDLPVMTHVYRDPNLKPLPLRPNVKEYFPWSSNRILNKEIVCVPNTATLPPEATKDKESWEQYGIHSSLVFPLSVGGGSLIGVLAFDNMEEHDWSEPLQRRLQILAHVFAQALDRKDAERKLRESEGRQKRHEEKLREYERAVEAADEMIAVVDREYRILIANRKYATMRNMTKEQIVGRFAHEVLDKGVFESVIKPKLDECFQGKVVRYEMKYTYPELGERDVAVSYFPIEGTSGVEGAACIFQDITERKRAEDALLSSEQRYRLLFEKNVAGVGIASLDGRVLDCNDGWARILGYESRDELRGRLTSEFYFNPTERQALLDELSEKQALLSRRLQLKRKDGSPVWVLFNGAALQGGSQTPMRQATMIDISEWNRAEEALSDMTRKLIESQEHERSRIGRELHDDINQRLAMLAVELEQLQDDPPEFRSRVQELRKQVTDISNDVQALSHDLHSSKLEYLGVIAGMKSWCKEFAERHKIEIFFQSHVPTAVPLELGLSLFRVLQEALQNAMKHSGVKRVDVQLKEDSGEIDLIISDSGKGFDVEAAFQGKGLGLTSMRERVRLVNGTILIESKRMGGTTIHVRVPLESQKGFQREAV